MWESRSNQYYFAGGFQFRTSVIGKLVASPVVTLTRKRPSGATAYCPRTTPAPSDSGSKQFHRRAGLERSALGGDRNCHQVSVQRNVIQLSPVVPPASLYSRQPSKSATVHPVPERDAHRLHIAPTRLSDRKPIVRRERNEGRVHRTSCSETPSVSDPRQAASTHRSMSNHADERSGRRATNR